jgi:hypothetical protein
LFWKLGPLRAKGPQVACACTLVGIAVQKTPTDDNKPNNNALCAPRNAAPRFCCAGTDTLDARYVERIRFGTFTLILAMVTPPRAQRLIPSKLTVFTKCHKDFLLGAARFSAFLAFWIMAG